MPMPASTVYKFRSFDRWDLVLDILVHKRMYAASFESLNDPMEGRYFYFGSAVSKRLQTALYQSKRSQRILSLSNSKGKTSTLLWSYYAGGHTGIAVGVRKPANRSLVVKDVTYDSGIYFDAKSASKPPDRLALEILTQKQMPWEHEGEVRVFSRDQYVPVKIVEVLLGCNVSDDNAKLVRKLVKQLELRVPVLKMRRTALDEPAAVRSRDQESQTR